MHCLKLAPLEAAEFAVKKELLRSKDTGSSLLLLDGMVHVVPGKGDSHIKKTGCFIVPFRGQNSGFGISKGVQPQKIHSGSFCSTQGMEPKK